MPPLSRYPDLPVFDNPNSPSTSQSFRGHIEITRRATRVERISRNPMIQLQCAARNNVVKQHSEEAHKTSSDTQSPADTGGIAEGARRTCPSSARDIPAAIILVRHGELEPREFRNRGIIYNLNKTSIPLCACPFGSRGSRSFREKIRSPGCERFAAGPRFLPRLSPPLFSFLFSSK